jgi:hypothetical protein
MSIHENVEWDVSYKIWGGGENFLFLNSLNEDPKKGIFQ